MTDHRLDVEDLAIAAAHRRQASGLAVSSSEAATHPGARSTSRREG
ncbi:MAG TPA: hypothetical protein VG412_12465 [Acidimicrobiales bacterium]|nr:hypothetical protein [Acidimicrobiales bacterium]